MYAENMGIITVEKLRFSMMLPALDQRKLHDQFLDICFRATANMGIFGGKENIARKRFMENRILCAWSILRRINKECKY